MVGLILEKLFYAVLHFKTLRNRLKMSEDKAYWLVNFPLINSWACLERIIIFLLKQYALVIKKHILGQEIPNLPDPYIQYYCILQYPKCAL